MTALKCPACGLYSPAEAERCDCGYDFLSKQMKASSLGTHPSLAGIGGWLTLPAIGLIVTIPGLVYAIGQQLMSGLRADTLVLVAIESGVLALVVAVTVAFFARKRAARWLMIALLAVQAAIGLILLAVPKGSPTTFVSAVIWMGYFLRSRRVEATFTR